LDLALSNYHPLLALKQDFGSHKLKDLCGSSSCDTVTDNIGHGLLSPGIEKLVSRYDIDAMCGGCYVEK
jgi:hypothetical protein